MTVPVLYIYCRMSTMVSMWQSLSRCYTGIYQHSEGNLPKDTGWSLGCYKRSEMLSWIASSLVLHTFDGIMYIM